MSSAGSVSVGGDVAQAGNTATGGVGEAGRTEVVGSGASGASGEGGTADIAGGGQIGGNGGLGGSSGFGGGPTFEIGAAEKAACANVCTKFGECPGMGSLGPVCQSDCESTFSVQDGACTDLGLQMMSCLMDTKAIKELDDCWIRFYDISQQCHPQVTAYRACLGATVATPLPDALCAQISEYTPAANDDTDAPATCREDRKCLSGLNYSVKCRDSVDGQSNCSCSLHDKSLREFVWQGSSQGACGVNLADCYALASSMFTP